MNQFVVKIFGVWLILFLPVFSAQAAQERTFLLATGDISGSQFALAEKLASALNRPSGRGQRKAMVVATVQVTPSADGALRLLRAGAVGSALVSDEVAFSSHTGDGGAVSVPDLRVLAGFEKIPMVILVRGDRNDEAVSDLVGGRIALGPNHTDRSDHAAWMLAALGLEGERYQTVWASDSSRMMALLLQHQADAAVLAEDELDDSTVAAVADGRLAVLEPSKSEMRQALARYPFLDSGSVRLGAGKIVTTLAVGSSLVVHAGLADDVVALVLERLAQEGLVRADESSPPAPLHSRAKSFYHRVQTPSLPPSPSPKSPQPPHRPSLLEPLPNVPKL